MYTAEQGIFLETNHHDNKRFNLPNSHNILNVYTTKSRSSKQKLIELKGENRHDCNHNWELLSSSLSNK